MMLTKRYISILLIFLSITGYGISFNMLFIGQTTDIVYLHPLGDVYSTQTKVVRLIETLSHWNQGNQGEARVPATTNMSEISTKILASFETVMKSLQNFGTIVEELITLLQTIHQTLKTLTTLFNEIVTWFNRFISKPSIQIR